MERAAGAGRHVGRRRLVAIALCGGSSTPQSVAAVLLQQMASYRRAAEGMKLERTLKRSHQAPKRRPAAATAPCPAASPLRPVPPCLLGCATLAALDWLPLFAPSLRPFPIPPALFARHSCLLPLP